MPKGVKGFTKGVSGNPNGRPEGSKNNTTLLKEERRAIFEQRVSEKFLDTIDKARPEYLLDQFLGKAPDELNLKGEIKNTGSMTSELLALLKAKLKEKQTQ